jgi:hypothetical protein
VEIPEEYEYYEVPGLYEVNEIFGLKAEVTTNEERLTNLIRIADDINEINKSGLKRLRRIYQMDYQATILSSGLISVPDVMKNGPALSLFIVESASSLGNVIDEMARVKGDYLSFRSNEQMDILEAVPAIRGSVYTKLCYLTQVIDKLNEASVDLGSVAAILNSLKKEERKLALTSMVMKTSFK